jgi:hypothetical protein
MSQSICAAIVRHQFELGKFRLVHKMARSVLSSTVSGAARSPDSLLTRIGRVIHGVKTLKESADSNLLNYLCCPYPLYRSSLEDLEDLWVRDEGAPAARG